MTKLNDYKPLADLSLPGINEFSCSGLILIVGPNSSGKTHLLRDIHLRLTGHARKLVVATNVKVAKPFGYPEFMQCLASEGYISDIVTESGNHTWLPRTTAAGVQNPTIDSVPEARVQQMYSGFLERIAADSLGGNDFLSYFGKYLVSALFLDRRLISLGEVPAIDLKNAAPTDDQHSLALNDSAREELWNETIRAFGKPVWLNRVRGSVLEMKVSRDGVIPNSTELQSMEMADAFPSFSEEGDGLRSYVTICVALLLGRRPVTIVDEPEMCLHPPQAHLLGQFIGRRGASADTVTFVATHSSHILRGAIEARQNIQIIRLRRRSGLFEAHIVPTAALTEAVSKPTVRSESILDGIFSECVVVVEADGDRLVYQTVWESLSGELKLDAHFATVGGTGGIAATCKLYALKIPVAVIADLDLVTDTVKLRQIMETLADTKIVNGLVTRAEEITAQLAGIRSGVEPKAIRAEIVSQIPDAISWQGDQDKDVQRLLSELSKKLDRTRLIKRGGIDKVPAEIRPQLRELVDDLKAVGVFLVPVGELEWWQADAGLTISKDRKSDWANAAAFHLQNAAPGQGDIWGFVREIGNHLRALSTAGSRR